MLSYDVLRNGAVIRTVTGSSTTTAWVQTTPSICTVGRPSAVTTEPVRALTGGTAA